VEKHQGGALMVIEGIDNAGKTSTIELIVPTLSRLGFNVAVLREFSSHFSSSTFTFVVQGTETPGWLQAMLRALEHLLSLTEVSQVLAAANGIVLADRYLDTNIVYQSLKLERQMDQADRAEARKRIADWIEMLYEWSPKPNHTFLLDVPVEVSLRRAANRSDLYVQKDSQFLESARRMFLERATKSPERYSIIDATQSQERIASILVETMRLKMSHNKGRSTDETP